MNPVDVAGCSVEYDVVLKALVSVSPIDVGGRNDLRAECPPVVESECASRARTLLFLPDDSGRELTDSCEARSSWVWSSAPPRLNIEVIV